MSRIGKAPPPGPVKYLYFGTYVDPGKIILVNPLPHIAVSSFSLPSGNCVEFILKDTYGYAVQMTSPINVRKFSVPDMVYLGLGSAAAGENTAWCGAYHGDYLYVGNNGGRVIKFDISGALPVRVNALTGMGAVYDMCIDGDFLYAASINGAYKIDLTTFTIVGTILGNAHRSAAVWGGYIYLGGWTVPIIIDRYTQSPFALDASLTLDPDEPSAYSLGVSGDILYVGCSAAGTLVPPGKMVRVDLPSFTRIDRIVFPAAELTFNDIVAWWSAYNYLFSCMYNPNPASKDYRFNISPWQVEGFLSLPSNYPWCMAPQPSWRGQPPAWSIP